MNRKWTITGAIVGLMVPLAFRVYEVWQFGHVRPAVLCLFWPATFFTAFNYPYGPLPMALAILGNMVIFGVVAGILRRKFLVVLAALVVSAYVCLPPSNAALTKRFNQQRATLERLTEMSKSDPEITRISLDEFETSDGKTHHIGDAETLLPHQRWIEYRRILGTLHMREATFSRSGSSEVFVAAQTIGVGPLRSYYGYVYCPKISLILSEYAPCILGRDSADRDDHAYKVLGSNWYIYKVFTVYEIK
jgi:hypothetical protein